MKQEFPIGTKFVAGSVKHQKEYTVIDFYTTLNLSGEIVKTCYVAECETIGQRVVNYDVPAATIKRSLLTEKP